MARVHASRALVAVLVLAATAVSAQQPPAGNGTIFMGAYSGHIIAVEEATGKVSTIPLKTGAPFAVRLSPDRTRFYVQSANQEHFEIVDLRRRESLDSFTLIAIPLLMRVLPRFMAKAG